MGAITDPMLQKLKSMLEALCPDCMLIYSDTDETEWVELVELGWNRLASPGNDDLAGTILGALGRAGVDARPYGDGRSAEAIAEILAR